MTEPLPEQSDNSPRPEDGPQNVSQSPDVDLSVASVDNGEALGEGYEVVSK